MNKDSKYFDLKWIVECRQYSSCWRQIAAFDCDHAAVSYAKLAKTDKSHFSYRVLMRDGRSGFRTVLEEF